MHHYKNILVPIDGSDTADRGLDESLKLARIEDARVHVLHVRHALSLGSAHDTAEGWAVVVLHQEQQLETIRQRLMRRGTQSRVDLRCLIQEEGSSSVADIILDTAALVDADLIVMGTHGHSVIRRLVVGSVTDTVLRSARIPVLLVPPERQVEPT